MRSLIAVLILSIASPAMGAIRAKVINVGSSQVLVVTDPSKTSDFNIIEGEATNGSPTVTIPLDRAWVKLRLFLFVTYAANTYVTIEVQCSLDGTNYATAQTRAIASGVATLSDLSDKKTLGAANQSPMTEYDVRGCQDVKITLGGDNTDAANLQAVAVR